MSTQRAGQNNIQCTEYNLLCCVKSCHQNMASATILPLRITRDNFPFLLRRIWSKYWPSLPVLMPDHLLRRCCLLRKTTFERNCYLQKGETYLWRITNRKGSLQITKFCFIFLYLGRSKCMIRIWMMMVSIKYIPLMIIHRTIRSVNPPQFSKKVVSWWTVRLCFNNVSWWTV